MTVPSASNATADIVEAKSKYLGSKAHPSEHASTVDIIDIRHDAVEINLKDEIMSSLRPQSGPKTMPTLLLYDERGLQLFEEVSRANQVWRMDHCTDNTRSRICKNTFLQMQKLMSSSTLPMRLPRFFQLVPWSLN